MTGALVAGIVAGLAVAIPVGAIAVLVIYQSAEHGLRTGAAAALGTASADGVYSIVAVVLGAAVAPLVASVQTPLRVVSAVTLAGLAFAMLRPVWTPARPAMPSGEARAVATPWRTYLVFLGLTMANPTTVVYFAALVAGATLGPDPATADRFAFVLGVLGASAVWQLTLALLGSALRRLLMTPGARRWSALIGGVLVLGLAVKAAMGW
ncbi:LysE family transporter [Demequina capsici]|uniref:LysE family transporter n=1 Tax=Demequina capsici TaxID=3075620 RepID=A0AA96FAA0_9MICO|nr:LysE family transporter [Demequina sp. OYTSA14]WNM24515.1 LysE family transporter [Demequina sp. OYTSA14]